MGHRIRQKNDRGGPEIWYRELAARYLLAFSLRTVIDEQWKLLGQFLRTRRRILVRVVGIAHSIRQFVGAIGPQMRMLDYDWLLASMVTHGWK